MSHPRILVVRIGALGDVLHALPAVSSLRARWPNSVIDWVIDTRWAPLLEHGMGDGVRPVVSHVFKAETQLWSYSPLSAATTQSVLQLRRALREEPYDFVVDMQGTLRSAVITRFAKSGCFAGYDDPREALAKPFYQRRLFRQGDHVVAQGAALLSDVVGVTLQATYPALPVHREAQLWADDLLHTSELAKKTAVLAPTAGWGAKQWPVNHFAELARKLVAAGWRVLVNAATVNDALCAEVVRVSQGAATAVVSTLPQLMALLRRADLMVGGDSGPVHLAATLGTPTLALFGPTDPARNGPWGPGPKAVLRHELSHTSYKRLAASDPGLLQISASQALDAIDSLQAG